MPSTEVTGVPSSVDYVLGRGAIYLEDLTGNGFIHAGNSPEVVVSVERETLEHFSSLEGLKDPDLQITLSQQLTLRMTLEAINGFNLAAFLAGQTSTFANSATIAGFAEYTMITDVKLGRWYEIVNASGVRCYNIDSADLTLEKSGAPDVLLVEGTDYELDLVLGLVFFKHDAVNIADDDEVDATLAADATAGTVDQVDALTAPPASRRVIFRQINANGDVVREYEFFSVPLAAEGDLNLISEELTQMQLQGVCEKNAAGDTLRIRNLTVA